MKPTFILGPPRSGTTLVKELLGHHPQISAHSTSFHTFHHNLQRFTSAVSRPEHYRQTTADVTASLRHEYTHAIEKALQQDNASVFILKISTLSQQVDYLRALFPNARFIQLVRDVRDSICSMESLRLALEQKHNRSRAYGPAPDPLSLWSQQNTPHPYINAACGWYYHITRSWLDRVWTNPSDYLRIRYEDLLQSPAANLERILVFLGLESSPALTPLLEEIQNTPTSSSAIGFSTTQAQRHRIGRYHEELTETIRTAIAPLVETPMNLLGYEPDRPQDTSEIEKACESLEIPPEVWLEKITREAAYFELHTTAFDAPTLFRQDSTPLPHNKPLLIDCVELYSKMVQLDDTTVGAMSGVRKQDRLFEFPDEYTGWPAVAPLLNGKQTVAEIQGKLMLEDDFLVLLQQLHQRGFLAWAP